MSIGDCDYSEPPSGTKFLTYREVVMDRAPAARELRELPMTPDGSGDIRRRAVEEAARAEQLFLAELFMTAVGHPSQINSQPDDGLTLSQLREQTVYAYGKRITGLLRANLLTYPEELVAKVEKRATEYLEDSFPEAAKHLQPYKDRLAREKAGGTRGL